MMDPLSWPIQKIQSDKKISRVNMKVWITLFISLTTIIFVFFYIAKLLNFKSETYQAGAAVSLAMVVVLLFLFALHCYKTGIEQVNHEAWLEESLAIKNHWRNWCSQQLHIIGHQLLLPVQNDKNKIISKSSLPVVKNQRNLFKESDFGLVTYQSILQELLFSLRGKIQRISLHSNFDVIFIKEPDLTLWDEFSNIWTAMGLSHNLLSGHIFSDDTYATITSRLLNEKSKNVTIIISIQLFAEKKTKDIMTESGCIFLFANHTKELNKDMPCCGYLYRPMLSNKDSIEDNLIDMSEYQFEFKNATSIYLSGVSEEVKTQATTALTLLTISEKLNNQYEITDLDLFLTSPGPWVALSLATLTAEKNKNTNLIACCEQKNIIFNTVRPYVMSKGERM
ncbi:hypothetical protein [Rahnella ecdela]|uniref:SMODS-associated and fused to various effectors domain-containing protein n=1 Tax=Rahnella ecdela TaxID=2816250 RepID=A0ABS6LIS1_9GAMM|nr:hypothetical protein [Rahnella ecdela]MBU9846839.1 hypothetical protein [Rahnella ecdela]